MDRRLTPDRLDQLIDSFDNWLICGSQFTEGYYFVLQTRARLPNDLAYKLAEQVLRHYRSLARTFCSTNSVPAKAARSLLKFSRDAPQADHPALPLVLVRNEPAPNTRVLRLPLADLFLRIERLRKLRFTNAHLTTFLALAIAHVSNCHVQYAPLGPNRFPPLADFHIMAQPPLLNISPTLPTFSGSPDEDVNTFIARLTRILAVYPDITAAQKIFYLENQTRDGAQQLIQRTLQYLADTPAPAAERTNDKIYSHLIATLKEAYCPSNDIQQHRDALQKRIKLDNESINMYVQAVLELCRRAKVTEINDQLAHLHKGLPLYLSTLLKPTDYNSVATFLSTVHAIDSAHKNTIRAHTEHALDTSQLLALNDSSP